MDEHVQPIKAFILPYGTDLSARLHLARTVVRRAERSIVALSAQEQVDPNILAYANRLSDFLFTLARYANKAQGVPDTLWKKDFPSMTPQVQTKLDTKQQENHNHHEEKPGSSRVVAPTATANGKSNEILTQ